MKRSNVFPFLMPLVLLSAGCSSGGSDGSQGPDALPSAAPPVAGQSPAPPPAGSGPNGQPGAIVVYSENGSVLNAVAADGQRRIAIAGDATYRGATEDGWVIILRGEDLLSVRLADGALRTLDDTPGSKHFRAVFDTNYVVYEKHTTDGQSSLHLVRADGSDRLVAAAAQPRPLQFMAVTPARRILYEVCEPLIDDDGVPCTDRNLLSARLDGGDERLVLAGAPLIRHITDDDLLVYDRGTEAGTVVGIVKSDGSGGRTLSEADSFFAGALPNGRLVYNRQLSGQLDLYSVATDGTERRALATSGEDEFYAGATPGGRVLFLRGSPQQRRLYSVDESTGDIRTMQVAGDSNVRAVAADGTVIVSSRFGADAGAQDNLYSVRADGTELRALADSSDMEWFEALAPDGRVIYQRCIAAPAGPCAHPSAQSDLYSVKQDATGTVALAASGAFEVARGVTQNNLVVYELLDANQSDLYSVPTTGGRAEPLANTGNDERFLTVIAEGTTGEQPGTHPDL